MKTVFIHIGLHKTGSTYIQKFFSEHRALLYEDGVDYPLLGAEFLFGHHNIAWSLMPGKSLQGTNNFSLEKLTRYVHETPVKNFVFSSEEFDFLRREHIDKLRKTLPRMNFKVVIYIRNPVNAFYSHWQEMVKHGSTVSLQSYYSNTLNNVQWFDYSKISERWIEVFGVNSLQVIIYDNLVDKQINIFEFFLKKILKLNVDYQKNFFSEEQVNPATALSLVEVIRQLNEIHQLSGNKDYFVGKVHKYIYKTEDGQAIQSLLKIIRDNPLAYLDLKDLEPKFLEIEQKFIHDYGPQVLNAASDRHLFVPSTSKNLKLPLLDIDRLKQMIDLEALYRDVMKVDL